MKKVKEFDLLIPVSMLRSIYDFNAVNLDGLWMYMNMKFMPVSFYEREYMSEWFYPADAISRFRLAKGLTMKEELIVDHNVNCPNMFLLEFKNPKALQSFLVSDISGMLHVSMSFKEVRDNLKKV